MPGSVDHHSGIGAVGQGLRYTVHSLGTKNISYRICTCIILKPVSKVGLHLLSPADICILVSLKDMSSVHVLVPSLAFHQYFNL